MARRPVEDLRRKRPLIPIVPGSGFGLTAGSSGAHSVVASAR